MKLLTPPKPIYLLDVDIEMLHEQSTEWLSEIAFWRDEAAFFSSLIIKKTLKSVPVSAKNRIKNIEKELISITIDDLDKLQKSVEQHEKFLSNLLRTESHEEETYRKKHHELAQTFVQFEKRFKALKKEVFSIVEMIAQPKVLA